MARDQLLAWFDTHRRPLPWRSSTPWGVMVSEYMLQQTPVARVLPVWEQWMQRWPAPADLAAQPQSEAIRAWGRLGYPRRAIRLHAAAGVIERDHDGTVPDDLAALRGLPGVGPYTAAAILAFAFDRRIPVVDVNVERFIRRHALGTDDACTPARVAAEIESRLPAAPARAARWSAAAMELGALVCRARDPRCSECPVRSTCRWRAESGEVAERRQRPRYEGSDRQARGAVLAALRGVSGRVAVADLTWPDAEQRERAIASLVSDGLIHRTGSFVSLEPPG